MSHQMAHILTSLADLYSHKFDDVIDVRSPAEFAQDHIPGAINLPVLSDAQRAEIGTIYTKVSSFKARKIGAAMVARNAASHLEGALTERDGSWRPLVYCWRGGQRSGSFASILSQIGWRVDTISGGYQSYRRLIVDVLHNQPLPHRLVLIDGNTGTAKTEILARLATRGAQVVDLEGLACHRGSVFGATGKPQPAQKRFESALARRLTRIDPDRPTLLEAESSKIGDLLLPPSLWKAMQAAPRITVSAPVSARAAYLSAAYADLTHDEARLTTTLQKLIPFHGRDRVAIWSGMVMQKDFTALAQDLIIHHYDRRYAKSRSARAQASERSQIDMRDLSDTSLNHAADEIQAEIESKM